MVNILVEIERFVSLFKNLCFSSNMQIFSYLNLNSKCNHRKINFHERANLNFSKKKKKKF